MSSARLLIAAPLLASGLLAAGCVSSPTYGTSKTANAQLTSDLSGMFSMKPKSTIREAEYKPRPELVRPASLHDLPTPQDNVTTANGAWPESPEQRRARLVAETTANQETALYDPVIVNDMPVEPKPGGRMKDAGTRQDEESAPMSNVESKQYRAEYNKRLEASNQGSPTTRKYLSEPPLAYREPAATASVGDVGEDEAVKDRRVKKAAKRAKGGGGWRDYVPWL